MTPLRLASAGDKMAVLCLGAHSDDIEIGAGATLLQWQADGMRMDVLWCVLSAAGPREGEARASAADFLQGADGARIETQRFRDGFFPAQSAEIKAWFEELKDRFQPDVIFTHNGHDAHQDHREVNGFTWNTFRNHLILEYEVPKWDGDVGRPNLYVPVSHAAMTRKVELLERHFGTQRAKHWFDAEVFRGLARLRGMECRARERYAEAFFARKLVMSYA
jgi:LmbE family N-acetylglucosaminyl deacetylase